VVQLSYVSIKSLAMFCKLHDCDSRSADRQNWHKIYRVGQKLGKK